MYRTGRHDGPAAGHHVAMTDLPSDVDPAIGEHVITIRNRFGVDGLREAQRLIALEIAIFEDAYDELETIERGPPRETRKPRMVSGATRADPPGLPLGTGSLEATKVGTGGHGSSRRTPCGVLCENVAHSPGIPFGPAG